VTTPDQVSPFEKPYWNLFQTIAWIYVDDDYLIKLFDDDVTDYVDEYSLPSIKTISDYGKPYDKEKLKFPEFEDAVNALSNALANEKLTCSGIDFGEDGRRKPIPHYLWPELRLIFDKDGVQASEEKKGRSLSMYFWSNLKFKREEIMNLWPTDTWPGIQAKDDKQKTIIEKPKELLYNPRHPIYIQVWDKLIELDDLEYGWRGIISQIPSMTYDKENGLVIGIDTFNEEVNVNIKSFRNTFSKMKQKLKE